MSSLHAQHVSLSLGPGPVLSDVSVSISPGQRIGIVGPNGAGKSTLLRVLAGLQEADSGVVSVAPPTATVGLLPQEFDRRRDETVLELVARRTGVADAAAELEAATVALAAGDARSDDRYSAALERWLGLGGADLDTRLGVTLAELGLDGAVADQPTSSLSGGQAARVSLAAVVVSRFDVALLDEPTNDLDFDGLARLERFIDAQPALAVVSHDRAFLERVATDVVELDGHHRTARLYHGGWQAYRRDRDAARRHAQQDYEAYETTRRRLADRARTQQDWSARGVRAAATSGETDKFIRFNDAASAENLGGKASATRRALDRLEVVDKPWEPWELRFEIGAATRSGDVVAALDGAVCDLGSFRLGPVDLQIDWADRVAVEGPNGAGKTTLIDALFGRRALDAGTAHVGPGVVVGEMGQGRRRFDGERTVFDVVSRTTGLADTEVRSLLAKFGLGAEHVGRAAGSLSPGERTRANLALFMAEGVNCLVLDEPTNHLDLAAIEQLEQALDRFVGTVVLVSHDRAFLERVSISRRVVVSDGRVDEVAR